VQGVKTGTKHPASRGGIRKKTIGCCYWGPLKTEVKDLKRNNGFGVKVRRGKTVKPTNAVGWAGGRANSVRSR